MKLIVAMTENGVIGFEGDMPWHLPADLAHFKKITTGHAVLMGRKTWDAIGEPLPNRMNIVVTRKSMLSLDGATVVQSIEEAVLQAANKQLFVIGGGEIYRATIDLVSTMYITRIHTTTDGDTYFPQIDTAIWEMVSGENSPPDDKNAFAMTFETWQRVQYSS